MAKDEDKKPEDAKDDAFTDSDEKAATPAETVASKRSSRPPPKDEDEPADDAKGEEEESEDESDEASSDDSDEESDEAEDSSEDDEEEEDEEEAPAAAAAKPARSTPPKDAYRAPAKPAEHHDDHGFAHVVSMQVLGGVLGALLFFTVLTVAAAKVDLGAEWNLVVAMVIATIKAGLVVTFFMHLLWDKKFNLLVFLSGVLFVILFISLALTDRKEYQPLIDQREAAQAQSQAQ